MYTRKGDRGETSLFGPKRVQKDDPRVEAFGTIDELNTVLGVVISGATDRSLRATLKEIQGTLFIAGADVATEMGSKANVPRITRDNTERVEELTDDLLSRLPKLNNFILPGGTPTAAFLQLARSVCRRAERGLVTASKSTELNSALFPFFNRLSSYLFNLARYANQNAGIKEEAWRPNPDSRRRS